MIQHQSLSSEVVNQISSYDVHSVLKRKMLVEGYDLVFDMNRSHDHYIVDAKTGKEYLDMLSFFASWPIRHNHPKLNNEEFIRQIGWIAIHNPPNSDIYTDEVAKFVATFERVFMPHEFKHLFLVSGGTLAVENALKVAFDWKVRKNLVAGKHNSVSMEAIHFKEAFHGRSGYSLSMTNTNPAQYMYYPLFEWPRFSLPKLHFPVTVARLLQVITEEDHVVRTIETLLQLRGDEIACIVLEPIQGAGGDNHIRPEFWQKLKQISLKYDVLLIADEIQSGMGLTGRPWAYQHLGDAPDIIAFGKKAQVCGIMCTDRIDEVPDNVFKVSSRIDSTWGGNLVDMVRSRKLMEIVEEEGLIANAELVGAYAIKQLQQLEALFPNMVSNVRGRGLMMAFDLPDKATCKQVIGTAYNKGLIITPCGTHSIRLRPMLDVSEKEIDRLCQILTHVVQSELRMLKIDYIFN